MYRVFLSHSRRDNAAAQAVFRWLTEAEPSLKGETSVIGNAVWSDIFVSALKEANLAEPQYDNQHAETYRVTRRIRLRRIRRREARPLDILRQRIAA